RPRHALDDLAEQRAGGREVEAGVALVTLPEPGAVAERDARLAPEELGRRRPERERAQVEPREVRRLRQVGLDPRQLPPELLDRLVPTRVERGAHRVEPRAALAPGRDGGVLRDDADAPARVLRQDRVEPGLLLGAAEVREGAAQAGD